MSKKAVFAVGSSVLLAGAAVTIAVKMANFTLRRIAQDSGDARESHLIGRRELEARPHEIWTITSHDGLRLVGNFFESPSPKNRIAVVVHGYGGRWSDSWQVVDGLLERGFGVLLPDDRGCGESGGNYMGFGYLDRLDYALWCRECARRYPGRRILLHGCSMGGATVLAASGEELPSELAAVIADCGFSSGIEQCRHTLKNHMHLPIQPFLALGEMGCKLIAKVDMRRNTPAEQCRRSPVPGLIIHGGSDDFVPTAMAQVIYDNYGAETGATKELLIIDGAKHAEAYTVDPDACFAAWDRLIARSDLATDGDRPYEGGARQ